MANEQNLIPFNKQTESEQRENSRKGGIASGEARRRKKSMKEAFELLLSLPVNQNGKIGNKIIAVAEDLGIPPEELDNQMAMCINMFSASMSKNPTQAFASIQATIGEKPVDNVKVEGNISTTNPLEGLSTEEIRKAIELMKNDNK